MRLLYADTSALVRAYFADEPDHELLRQLLLEGEAPVVTSEVARIELARAVAPAARAGRLRRPRDLLARVDADCGGDGPISLLRLRPEVVLPTAYSLVIEQGLRTLDAIHLAVAAEEAQVVSPGADVVFVTRDGAQATVAAALGFAVA